MVKSGTIWREVCGAVLVMLVIATLGWFGAVTPYAYSLGAVGGIISFFFGTTVHFDGELLTVIRDSHSLLQKPLALDPKFSYSAIPLLTGLMAATPGFLWRQRVIFGALVPLGTLIAQAFLLTGFSLVGTSTPELYSASKSMYTAWWSMGPLLVAAWWFWTRWLPILLVSEATSKPRRKRRRK